MGLTDWLSVLDTFDGSSKFLSRDVERISRGEQLPTYPADWDRTSSTYFAFTVATTIGYGSFTPMTQAGRFFTVCYALVAIPLLLLSYTSFIQLVLRALARRLAGKEADRPFTAFRILDSDRSGTLSRPETLRALESMGLGAFAGRNATPSRRARFEAVWEECDADGKGELGLDGFRLLLERLVPDEDREQRLIDHITRGYVAIVALCLFFAFCAVSTALFHYLKRDEGWSVLDSVYYTAMTLLTIGLGDLAPDPHPTYYMVLWTLATFFGLGFTTALMQILADPQLKLRGTLRSCCPTWLTGAATRSEITTGVVAPTGSGPVSRLVSRRRSSLHRDMSHARSIASHVASAGSVQVRASLTRTSIREVLFGEGRRSSRGGRGSFVGARASEGTATAARGEHRTTFFDDTGRNTSTATPLAAGPFVSR